MEILLSNNQEIPVDEELIYKVAGRVLLHEGAPDSVELSIALVDEAEIQRLNKTYRDKDAPTDVLSFESSDEMDRGDIPLILGDVVICPAIAAAQAQEYGQTFDEEMSLLTIHGVLHLLGYNHESDAEAEEMERIERKLLSEIFSEGPSGSKGPSGQVDGDEK